jgi:MFS family permease
MDEIVSITIRKLKVSLRSLQSRNFRLFFIGQGISVIGTWMAQVATIWLAYELTQSALTLGVLGFISEIPIFLISPFAGVFVDRSNRYRLLIITQILTALRSAILAILVLTGIVNIWYLLLLSITLGSIASVEIPTRQAFVPDMVEREADLGNAIALSSSLASGARLIGPAIAGIIIATIGASWCFLIDSISYVAVIAALLAMKITTRRRETPVAHSAWGQLKEGFDYSFNSLPIRSILLLLALVYFMGTPFIALGPILASEILGGESDVFGFLMTTSGIGALIGGVYLSSRQEVKGFAKLLAISPAILGIALIGFSLSRVLWLSLLMVLLVGFCLMVQNAASNTVLQTILENDKRGRVMSLHAVASESMVPFGNLFAGALAIHIGATNTLAIEGIFCLIGSFLFTKYLPRLNRSLVQNK